MKRKYKRKNKNTKLIFTVISISILLLGLLFYFGFYQQAVVSFQNQCMLSNCPSGYTDIGTICQDLKCTRACQMESGSHCGSFSSIKIESKEYNRITADLKNTWFVSPSITESTNKCYQYQASNVFQITNRDPGGFLKADSESHEVYASSILVMGDTVACSSSNTVEAISGWTQGKVGTGKSVKVSGKYISYKSSTCIRGDDAYGSEGIMTVSLLYKTADLVKDYVYTETSCNYQCQVNSDCGVTQTGSLYCDGSNIVRDVTKNTCSNYKCIDKKNTEIVTKCNNGCSGTTCIQLAEETEESFFENLLKDKDEVISNESIVTDTITTPSTGTTTDQSSTKTDIKINPLFFIIPISIILLIIIIVFILIWRKRK